MSFNVIPIRRTVAVASVQGSLALDLTPRLDPPETGVQLLPTTWPGDLVRTDAAQRAELDRFVRRHLACAVEIACGDRPTTQVLRHCSPDVYADLARRAQLVTRAAGTTPAVGRGRGAIRPVLRSAHTSLVRADALEAAAHVRYGARSRALAARFEVLDGRWQCVALEWA
ncbi:Rv3235 family protein [Nocardioides sp.]|uniref:Rv3235 family protein n=1 Tax=Nocardioides sp. TaxID=35761 RepID=UPI00286EA2A9|nr:Rv3235 family protein [Nocardioides sp.]